MSTAEEFALAKTVALTALGVNQAMSEGRREEALAYLNIILDLCAKAKDPGAREVEAEALRAIERLTHGEPANRLAA